MKFILSKKNDLSQNLSQQTFFFLGLASCASLALHPYCTPSLWRLASPSGVLANQRGKACFPFGGASKTKKLPAFNPSCIASLALALALAPLGQGQGKQTNCGVCYARGVKGKHYRGLHYYVCSYPKEGANVVMQTNGGVNKIRELGMACKIGKLKIKGRLRLSSKYITSYTRGLPGAFLARKTKEGNLFGGKKILKEKNVLKSKFETNKFQEFSNKTLKKNSSDKISHTANTLLSPEEFYLKKAKNFYSSYSKLYEINQISINLASPERIRYWAEKILPNQKVIGRVTNANTLHYKSFKPQKGGLFCERIFGPLKDFECACGKSQKKVDQPTESSYHPSPRRGEEVLPLDTQDKPLLSSCDSNLYKAGSEKLNEATPVSSEMGKQENRADTLNKEIELNSADERKFCPNCDVEYTWSVIRRYQLGYIQLVAPVTHLWYLKGTPSYLSLLLNIKKKDLEAIIYCSESMTLEAAWNHKFLLSESPSNLFLSWQNIIKSQKKENQAISNFPPSFNFSASLSSSIVNTNSSSTNVFTPNSQSFSKTNLSKEFFNPVKNVQEEYLLPQRLNNWRFFQKSPFLVSLDHKHISLGKKSTRTDVFLNKRNEIQKNKLINLKINREKKQLLKPLSVAVENLQHIPITFTIFLKLEYLAQKKAIFLFVQKTWKNFYKKSYLLASKKATYILKKVSFKKLGTIALSSPSQGYYNKKAQPGMVTNQGKNNRTRAIDQKRISKKTKLITLLSFFEKRKKTNNKYMKKNTVPFCSLLSKRDKTKEKSFFNFLKKIKCYFKKYVLQSLLVYSVFPSFLLSLVSSTTLSPLYTPKQTILSSVNPFAVRVNGARIAKLRATKAGGNNNKLLPKSKYIWLKNLNTKKIAVFKANHLSIKSLKELNPLIQVLSAELAKKIIKLQLKSNIKQKGFEGIFFKNLLGLESRLSKKNNMDFWTYFSKSVIWKNNQVNLKENKKNLQKPQVIPFVYSFIKAFLLKVHKINSLKRKTSFKTDIFNFKTQNLKIHNPCNTFLFPKDVRLAYFSIPEGLSLLRSISSFAREVKGLKAGSSFDLLLPSDRSNAREGADPLRWKQETEIGTATQKGTKKKKAGIFESSFVDELGITNTFYTPSNPQKRLLIQKKQRDLLKGSFEEKIKKKGSDTVTSKSNFTQLSKEKTIYNNIYSLSHTFNWKKEKDWRSFFFYISTSVDYEDIPIINYKNRIPDSDTPSFVGAGIIQKLLGEFNVEELKKMDKQNRIQLYEFTQEMNELKKFVRLGLADKSDELRYREILQERNKLIRRLKLTRVLYQKKSNPESMILSTLPVLPPDLRPIIKIEGQIAASDLNRFYQRILYRNERLKKFLKDPATRYSYEMKFTQRLLQESVDNLISNGKGKVAAEKDSRGRPLKSLSDILKGKEGRFRQHLLGKRVDYSGRSVIVVGPKLKIHQCGLPKEMALELFLPFLLKRLIHSKMARTVIGAKTILQTNPTLTLEILNEVMQNHPILLNRAPTLHRLGIQAFQAKLVEGRAILLHPLVCPAFNADFDGDQMAVHVPITVEARAEAWKLMFSRGNLLSPATGDPILLPSQDMVLGCYYLTTESLKYTQLSNIYFSNIRQVMRAYYHWTLPQKMHLHSIIWLKYPLTSPAKSDGQALPSLAIKSLEVKEEVTAKSGVGAETVMDKKLQNSSFFSKKAATPFEYSTEIFENDHDYEEPIEIRIEKKGNWKEVSKKMQQRFDKKNKLISRYIRTTVGRIIFNLMVQDCIN